MNFTSTESIPNKPSGEESQFNGIYGNYTITTKDKLEVKLYRLSLLICGISFVLGISHWILIGPNLAWIWLILMTISLGTSILWIHIYLRPLHNFLKILWGLGTVGISTMALTVVVENIMNALSNNKIWLIIVGPIFASLTGLGFKEFFCFRRVEAIGFTILIPISLLGHLSGLINKELVILMLIISALMLMILALRKFGTAASDDIGDKSIFDYLERKETPDLVSE